MSQWNWGLHCQERYRLMIHIFRAALEGKYVSHQADLHARRDATVFPDFPKEAAAK